MERTVKIPAYTGDAKPGVAKDNLTKEQKVALELATRNAQIEEEKNKSLEQLKTIELLQQNLQQEQGKSATLEKKITALESRVKMLSDVLDKISSIAITGKAG